MSGRIVVPMAEEHLEDIAALERLCFSQPWSEASLREELENPDAVFLVCMEGDQFAGYAGMHTPAGDCYIDNIAVVPACRNKGVAGSLLKALEEKARERGGSFLSLEVRPSNTAAVRLYRSFGFAEAGVRKRFYEAPEEDALILTKSF